MNHGVGTVSGPSSLRVGGEVGKSSRAADTLPPYGLHYVFLDWRVLVKLIVKVFNELNPHPIQRHTELCVSSRAGAGLK